MKLLILFAMLSGLVMILARHDAQKKRAFGELQRCPTCKQSVPQGYDDL